jgi:hypothetical protein
MRKLCSLRICDILKEDLSEEGRGMAIFSKAMIMCDAVVWILDMGSMGHGVMALGRS